MHAQTGTGVLRSIVVVLQDVLKSKCTSGALLDKYGKMCCVLDEIINEVRDCVRVYAHTRASADVFYACTHVFEPLRITNKYKCMKALG